MDGSVSARVPLNIEAETGELTFGIPIAEEPSSALPLTTGSAAIAATIMNQHTPTARPVVLTLGSAVNLFMLITALHQLGILRATFEWHQRK